MVIACTATWTGTLSHSLVRARFCFLALSLLCVCVSQSLSATVVVAPSFGHALILLHSAAAARGGPGALAQLRVGLMQDTCVPMLLSDIYSH